MLAILIRFSAKAPPASSAGGRRATSTPPATAAYLGLT